MNVEFHGNIRGILYVNFTSPDGHIKRHLSMGHLGGYDAA